MIIAFSKINIHEIARSDDKSEKRWIDEQEDLRMSAARTSREERMEIFACKGEIIFSMTSKQQLVIIPFDSP